MRGFGYEGAVKSPTYTIIEPYEFEKIKIYHFDLYRLSYAEEVEYLGAEEYFSSANLCLIEWPERGLGSPPLRRFGHWKHNPQIKIAFSKLYRTVKKRFKDH